MYINNKILKTIFRISLIAICLYGIILNITSWGDNWFGILSYYTLQSNIVVLIFFSFLLLRNAWTKKTISPTVKGGVTVCITLTFIIYHFILRPTMFTMDAARAYNASLANTMVHYIVPIMTIADWLLFDKKGLMKKLDPVKWLIIPLAYLIFSLVRAELGSFASTESRYPYFFLDIDKYGVGQVALNVLGVGVGYLALGYVFYFIDLGLSKITIKKHAHAKNTRRH
jgi:hypothetical protein